MRNSRRELNWIGCAASGEHRTHSHLSFESRACVCCSSSLSCRRSAIASRVCRPCFNALVLPFGAPDPAAPPCIRQRFLPLTAGDRHGFPRRVRAPQRVLDSIGPVLRGWLPVIVVPRAAPPHGVWSGSHRSAPWGRPWRRSIVALQLLRLFSIGLRFGLASPGQR
jgi:hypothetical protein